MALCVFFREVRLLETLFAYGVIGLAVRCIMDLVVFRAEFAQVRRIGPIIIIRVCRAHSAFASFGRRGVTETQKSAVSIAKHTVDDGSTSAQNAT